jgi:hypothetical protein
MAVPNGHLAYGAAIEAQEVKGAYVAFEALESGLPFSVNDILVANKLIVGSLADVVGHFSQGRVGVFQLLLLAPLAWPAK